MSSPKFPDGRLRAASHLLASTLFAAFALSACGGGGGSSSAGSSTAGNTGASGAGSTGTGTGTGTTVATPDPIPANFQDYANLCAAPRTGVDAQGLVFPDRQGTLQDEMKFLRGWIDKTYLWYGEIPATVHMADYGNTLDYFAALKTPATTASGKPKDQFHFTYTTAQWDALSNASQDVGYGLTFSFTQSTAPRIWKIAIVEPGSPAAAAGLQRGDQITVVDGIDFVNSTDRAQIATLNAGFLPSKAGETHALTFQRAGQVLATTMTSAVVTTTPVKNVKVVATASGKVGYLSFDDFNAVSEQQLVDAFTSLKSQGATDLVLDMRYNGGGLLYIASELAYMIAGPAASGKVFERETYNDKTAQSAPINFMSTAYGFSARAGQALPYLGIKHVTVLTTPGTCSASEAVVNGLRGIDVQVDIVGGQTCGKPYGFVPQANCGTTYFAIQFQGVNAKGFGDYADGFAPTCNVADDLTHAIGDPAETMLAAALSYRTGGTCPAGATASAAAAAHSLAQTRAMSEAKNPGILPLRRRQVE